MKRREAISLILESELGALSEEERESLLLDWWTIDEDDAEFGELPEILRTELKQNDEPEGTRKPHYDALLRIGLRRRFVGVRNEYLVCRISELGHSASVEGNVEWLESCPCCGFRTLGERGGYEICRVCFWEDDGSQEPDCFSVANRLTLREARENFASMGAVNDDAVGSVLRDGTARYDRG